jgi:hypothetical protein
MDRRPSHGIAGFFANTALTADGSRGCVRVVAMYRGGKFAAFASVGEHYPFASVTNCEIDHTLAKPRQPRSENEQHVARLWPPPSQETMGKFAGKLYLQGGMRIGWCVHGSRLPAALNCGLATCRPRHCVPAIVRVISDLPRDCCRCRTDAAQQQLPFASWRSRGMPLFRLQPHGMEGVEAREAGKNGSGKSGGSRSWPCGSRWRMKRAPAVVAPRPLVAAIPLQLPGAVPHG